MILENFVPPILNRFQPLHSKCVFSISIIGPEGLCESSWPNKFVIFILELHFQVKLCRVLYLFYLYSKLKMLSFQIHPKDILFIFNVGTH
jgi:hypothetical protein